MDDMQKDAAGQPVTVYSHNNPGLRSWGVSFHWWDAAYTSLHDHDHFEFFIITSGRTNHILNGRCGELGEKTMCLIRPEDCHQFTPIAGQRCIHINLPVTEKKLAELCAAGGISLDWVLRCPRRELRLMDSDLALFMRSAQEVAYLQGTDGVQPYITMLLCQLVLHAVTLLCRPCGSAARNMPEWLEQLLLRIHSPEYMDCRVSDIYALAGYSPPVVIRSFERYTGQTVVAYLTKVKMDFAKQMLESSDLTVLDIAGRLGYGSVSHFNRLFRSSTGVTPRTYRLRCRESG